ncbi:MAG: four helix bundle protein [Candidatus Brachytrichaceae bacterium NZ_4S206]|jgi:four helix bundle protein
MTFEEWLANVPPEISQDPLWQMTVYRQALFIGDLAWHDSTKLAQDQRTCKLSGQLYEAAGGISATIAEGYSRGHSKVQAQFYEYALGSARETRDWYYKGRHVLGQTVATHRMKLLVHIMKQLLRLIPEHRGRRLSEAMEQYDASTSLFNTVPMPE